VAVPVYAAANAAAVALAGAVCGLALQWYVEIGVLESPPRWALAGAAGALTGLVLARLRR
jgi:hypothetical protein